MAGTSHGRNEIQPPDGAEAAQSDDEKAKAGAAQAEAAKAKASDKFVLYLGPSNVSRNTEELKKRPPKLGEGTYAEITPTQWGQVGIAATNTVKFSLANSWRVPVSAFSDAQLDYLLTNSKRFVVVDGTGAPTER